jgi:hypothetical protein
MRVLKILIVVGIGILVGGAGAVFLVNTCASTVGPPKDIDLALLIGAVAVLAGAGCGGGRGYYFFLHTPTPNTGHHLSPDAERDARARFMQSDTTGVDDDSIQPDKQGLNSEDS